MFVTIVRQDRFHSFKHSLDVNGAARESASVASANGTAVVVKVGTQLADAERQLIEAATGRIDARFASRPKPKIF